MTKCKRLISVVSIISVLTIFLSVFSISASAATGKTKYYDAFSTKTITVTTEKKGSPYITFKSVGTGSYQYKAKAPTLSLKVYNHNTKKTEWYWVKGTGNTISSKLKLSKNCKYTVTVSYLYQSRNWGTYGTGDYKKTSWYQGTWRVDATSKLSYTIK